jgi:DNA processing protein
VTKKKSPKKSPKKASPKKTGAKKTGPKESRKKSLGKRKQPEKAVEVEKPLPVSDSAPVLDDAAIDPVILHRLALTRGVGYRRLCALRQAFPKIEAVFSAPLDRLSGIERFGKKLARAILDPKTEEMVYAERKRAEAEGINIVYHGHFGYPDELNSIFDPPLVLYIKGSLSSLAKPAFAIVGSRNCGTYGRKYAAYFGRELARSGFTVVSGLARGADAEAHRGALDTGTTAAVLGCGVDVVYPPEHRDLADVIAEKGCIISEFPLGTNPERGNFPRRNRIISGLSIGVLVIQAGARSGALITARWATEQGKSVFAVPGRIDVDGSTGSNRLIKDGAHLAENVRDILEVIAPEIARRRSELGEEQPGEKLSPPSDLSENSLSVFRKLEVEAKHIDVIAAETGLGVDKAAVALLDLELRRLVVRNPGQTYSLP